MSSKSLVLYLPYPPTVNTAYYTDFKTKSRHKSASYRNWIKEASECLLTQKRCTFDKPVKTIYEVWRPDKRRRDIKNIEKCLDDFLVSMGVLADDSLIVDHRIFWSHSKPEESWHGVKVIIEKNC